MCGIAGFTGQGDKQVLEGMIRALKHRGPDDEGLYMRDDVGFAHTRLAIIDLSPAGHQPMLSADGSVAISFNGEIYNYRELKEELQKKNKYRFRSNSDTEVIVCLYQEYGEEVFSQLNGMFAIALYDFNKKKLILARDRMGKKPLYYSVAGNTLFFGSELKALKEHTLFAAKLNLHALNKYLLYEYVPTPDSIFSGVFKLEPATYLTWQGGQVAKKSFWQMHFGETTIPFETALGELDRHLDRSVAIRLVSDVPLGIFLSGGIDSSTIAYYAQKNSAQKIQTFSIGFAEESFDETSYARQVALLLNTDHHEHVLSARDSLELIPRIADFLDEPLADASLLPTYLLSKFTRSKVTVALGGDGGDELFAGYPTFQAQKIAEQYKKIPTLIRKGLIEKVIRKLPVKDTNFSMEFMLKKFIDGVDAPHQYMHQHWLGSFPRKEREKLFTKELWTVLQGDNEFDIVDRYYDEGAAVSPADKLIYTYLRTYLMDEVLVKVDRASMYNALEVRAPLLDYQLVDFVNNLPLSYKLRGFTTKYILKKVMEQKLPHDIVYRKKKGFGIPLAVWLRKDLRAFATDLLSKETITKAGLFNYPYIEQLLHDHFNRVKDNRKQLWTLIVFHLWHERQKR